MDHNIELANGKRYRVFSLLPGHVEVIIPAVYVGFRERIEHSRKLRATSPIAQKVLTEYRRRIADKANPFNMSFHAWWEEVERLLAGFGENQPPLSGEVRSLWERDNLTAADAAKRIAADRAAKRAE